MTVKTQNFLISENTVYIDEKCGMSIPVVTLVTKLLVSLA